MLKVVFFDLDGTLCDDRLSIGGHLPGREQIVKEVMMVAKGIIHNMLLAPSHSQIYTLS